MATSYTLPQSSQQAMTDRYPPKTYRTTEGCLADIAALSERLQQHRDDGGDAVTGFVSTLKVPGCYKPGLAFGMISDGTFAELRAMGVGRAEIEPTEHTTYTAPLSGSRKEGGCGRKNALLRSLDNGCPHFVIEAGLSESLPGLRQDVNWWFANSGETGALLALLISISRANRTTTIEKYHPIPRQTQATGGGVVYVKHLVSTTIVNMGISAAAVEGQPLVLGFHRIVGRQPVGLEHDLTFTGITLLEIGRAVFRN